MSEAPARKQSDTLRRYIELLSVVSADSDDATLDELDRLWWEMSVAEREEAERHARYDDGRLS